MNCPKCGHIMNDHLCENCGFNVKSSELNCLGKNSDSLTKSIGDYITEIDNKIGEKLNAPERTGEERLPEPQRETDREATEEATEEAEQKTPMRPYSKKQSEPNRKIERQIKTGHVTSKIRDVIGYILGFILCITSLCMGIVFVMDLFMGLLSFAVGIGIFAIIAVVEGVFSFIVSFLLGEDFKDVIFLQAKITGVGAVLGFITWITEG